MVGSEGRRLFNKNNQLAGGSPNHILRMFSYSAANPIMRNQVEALFRSPRHRVETTGMVVAEAPTTDTRHSLMVAI
jgi:hypothetical protein